MDDLHVELLKVAAKNGYESIANALGKHPTTVGRYFSGENGVPLKDIEVLLGVCGFRIVPMDTTTVDETEYQLLVEMAAKVYGDRAAKLRKATVK